MPLGVAAFLFILTFARSFDLLVDGFGLANASVFFGVVGFRPGADFPFGPFYPR